MPQVRDIALKELTEGGNAVGVAATRVDSAHSLGDALTSLPPLADMPVEQAIIDLVRVEGAVQLKLQADQLAAHLDRRRQELERREAELNARQAAFEQELREARQWLVKRNDELNEREARLDAREEGFMVQGSGVRTEAGDATVGNALSGVPQTDVLRGIPPTEADPQSRLSLGERAPFRGAKGDFEPASAPLASPKLPLSEAVWRQRREALIRLSEELDRRRLELEESREEVSQMHDEALELRSAAEELQAELRAAIGEDAADKALKSLRESIAQRYRNEVAYLTRRRSELECLKKDLADEHVKLEQRYQEFKAYHSQPTSGHPATDHAPKSPEP